MVPRDRIFSLLLLILSGSLLTACGDDSEGGVEETKGGAEAEAAPESFATAATLQKELYDAVVAIESVEDVASAETTVGSIVDRMAKSVGTIGDAGLYEEYQVKLAEHVEQISAEKPEVGIAIGTMLARLGNRLAGAAKDASEGESARDELRMVEGDLQSAERRLQELSGN